MESFERIKCFYKQYWETEKSKGSRSHKETDKGFWLSSVSREIFDLFCVIKLQQFNNFADLGSGDGKVAAIASLFTNAMGIEWDEELCERSMAIKDKMGLKNLQFERGDFLQKKLDVYDILFIHPDNPLAHLEKKLLKEFEGDLIVCGGLYLPEKLVEKNTVRIKNATFRIYRKRRWPWFQGTAL